MYIEFTGVPGAGKTTVSEQVRELLEKKNIDCVTRKNFFRSEENRSHKSIWSLLHLTHLDLYALLLWLRLSCRRRMGLEKTFTRIHEYQKLRYQIRKGGDNNFIVWDNGFVQWFSNHISAGIINTESAVDFIKKRLPPNTLLVLIYTPIDVVVRRMEKREAELRATRGVVGWKLRVDEIEKSQRAFTESYRIQEDLFEALAARDVITVKLDGTKPPTENAALVYEFVKKQL